MIWRSRLDKLCDYFNRTWLEWTGKTMEQEFGHGWAKGVHPDDFDACLETYVAAFDRREAFYMEYRLIDKHGQWRWIGDHGRPFYDLDDTFLGYIGSCYDITENKVNQQKLLSLNATKDKFFSIVAHDLRNPISAFVSLSEYVLENGKDFDEAEMEEIATQMHKDAKNTLMLLENLLEWSRSQSDEIKCNKEVIGLRDLCEEVVLQANVSARAKKVSLTVVQAEDISIAADKNMLNTILRNLVMNAIKFTEPGGRVHIKAEKSSSPTDSENDNVLVTVSDTGLGMPQEHLSGLFDLAKHSRTRSGTENEKGSGLGLVICKDFVERHGGKIWAESESGKGTEMKISLPIGLKEG